MRLSRRSLFWIAFAALLLMAIVSELLSRVLLGLGDPPLTVRDKEIEYLFAPSKTYHRFGNNISYNAYSMRSDDVSPAKGRPDELRILVLRDSVINGGALTDDNDLGTRIAQRDLREVLNRPVWIGNVSAGSWGPGNLLAYVRRFGWFDADLAVVVLNSGDIADVPEFPTELGPDFPERAPLLALQELFERYVARYVTSVWARVRSEGPQPGTGVSNAQLSRGRELLAAFLADAKEHVPAVVVVHHRGLPELTGHPEEDAFRDQQLGDILDIDVRAAGLQVVNLKPRRHPQGDATALFRDDIHLNVAGQKVLASAIMCLALNNVRVKDPRCA